jgi:hypothetical protein
VLSNEQLGDIDSTSATMAQGTAKSGKVPKGDKAQARKAKGTQAMRKKSGGKRKGAPAKQLKDKRDKVCMWRNAFVAWLAPRTRLVLAARGID